MELLTRATADDMRLSYDLALPGAANPRPAGSAAPSRLLPAATPLLCQVRGCSACRLPLTPC